MRFGNVTFNLGSASIARLHGKGGTFIPNPVAAGGDVVDIPKVLKNKKTRLAIKKRKNFLLFICLNTKIVYLHRYLVVLRLDFLKCKSTVSLL